MPARKFDNDFLKTGLVCPDDRQKIEYTSDERNGLYLEVRKTSEGQGTFWYRFKDETGKTARVKIGRTTDSSLREIRDRVRILAGKRASGESIAALTKKKSSLTWSQLFHDHYLPYKLSHGKKSLKWDKDMNKRIDPRFGHVPINKLTPVQIRQFHMELKDSGLSPATADHFLKLIRHALNCAVDWDLLKINPALKVKQFNQPRIINRALDADELTRLMKVLTTDSNRMACNFFMLSLALGTRKGELLLAEWKHVDIAKKTLFIPGSNAKSSRDRYVFLSEFALQIINKLGTSGKHQHLFISSRTRKRLTSVSKAWTRLCNDAQIKDCRIHDLRRTHGTLLGESGVNAMLIKDALGHASVTTTQIYVSPHNQARQDAANIAGDHLTAALEASYEK
jgi:integrase